MYNQDNIVHLLVNCHFMYNDCVATMFTLSLIRQNTFCQCYLHCMRMRFINYIVFVIKSRKYIELEKLLTINVYISIIGHPALVSAVTVS